jgi:hypothetical protein
MVRGNDVLPNARGQKKWQFRVKTWFNQPARKVRRRAGETFAQWASGRALAVARLGAYSLLWISMRARAWLRDKLRAGRRSYLSSISAAFPGFARSLRLSPR